MLVIISCILFRCNFGYSRHSSLLTQFETIIRLSLSLSHTPFLFLSYMTKGDYRSLTSVQRVPINLIFTSRNNSILANYIIVLFFFPHGDKASALFLFIYLFHKFTDLYFNYPVLYFELSYLRSAPPFTFLIRIQRSLFMARAINQIMLIVSY